MNEWRRLKRLAQVRILEHYLAVCPTKNAAARALGLPSSHFRRLCRRLRHQPPDQGTPARGRCAHALVQEAPILSRKRHACQPES